MFVDHEHGFRSRKTPGRAIDVGGIRLEMVSQFAFPLCGKHQPVAFLHCTGRIARVAAMANAFDVIDDRARLIDDAIAGGTQRKAEIRVLADAGASAAENPPVCANAAARTIKLAADP